jgi:deoxycytidylate deaminase
MDKEKVRYLMRQAYLVAAEYSDDPNTHCGVIIFHDNTIISKGANCFTHPSHRGLDKYSFIEHAERVAIFEAAKNGSGLEGSTMVCPWASCTGCARAIMLSGIDTVIVHTPAMEATPKRWQVEIAKGHQIFVDGGVRVEWLDEKIGLNHLMDGKLLEV